MLPEVDLLPKIERQNSAVYILFVSGLLLFLLLLLVFIYSFFTTKHALGEVEQNLAEVNEEKTVLLERITSLKESNDKDTYGQVMAYTEHQIIPTSRFIDEIIALLPESGYLSSYTYNYQSVTIETQLETMSDVAAYFSELNASPFITDVKVNQMNTFDINSNQDRTDMYEVIPRYTVNYTIDVDQRYMKEEVEGNE
ncbi:PilN domain-containing protein [Ornithinibacillus massiliensis]|uniref:PilN domain-containing protein n=1 Tax=Ornithinibacillus massiliensis TaxID=1944633 RepID=A0ABS5MI59_9BACI|nr:PilN domain-containing protein [Ornithinibacillus massiliensis]MBS3682030.1 PilN domain-containing protein [Ornithinibacillus massiliensis]